MSVATDDEIAMIADSRIAWSNEKVLVQNARDVCQKLFVPSGWCLLGFSGNLCLGRDVLRALFKWLKETDPFHPHWLRSDEMLKDFLRSCVAQHSRRRTSHNACARRKVEFMIAWLDYGRNPFVQPMQVVVVESPELAVRRLDLGIDIIGSGKAILDRMKFESFMEIIWRYRDEPDGNIKRALFSAGEAAKHLRQTRELTVGGLFQIAVLSTKGAELVDHFQFIPLDAPWVGTYVAMRTRAGMWLQEHRPTQSIVKIVAPFDIQLEGPHAKESMIFDKASDLSKDSPGAIQVAPPGVLEFCRYDPGFVPVEIRRSWGNDPLEPLSYAQGPPPKRWRRH